MKTGRYLIKRAIIDIDNTLWHFCDALYEQLRKLNKEFPPPAKWTHWDLWAGYCSEEDFYSAVNAVHLNQHCKGYVPYPEAKDFLVTLKKHDYLITIASHRSPDYRRQTEMWLEMHSLMHDELHLSFDKTQLFGEQTDVVVDDAPQILEKAVEAGIKAAGLLFPWNQAYSDNGFRLFNNLNDILSHILAE